MASGMKAFLKQEQEIKKRVRQIEDLIREKNQLRKEKEAAERKAMKLLGILQDIALAEEGQARQIARKELARIGFKLEKKEAA